MATSAPHVSLCTCMHRKRVCQQTCLHTYSVTMRLHAQSQGRHINSNSARACTHRDRACAQTHQLPVHITCLYVTACTELASFPGPRALLVGGPGNEASTESGDAAIQTRLSTSSTRAQEATQSTNATTNVTTLKQLLHCYRVFFAGLNFRGSALSSMTEIICGFNFHGSEPPPYKCANQHRLIFALKEPPRKFPAIR